jgi:hypothetical protein
VPATNFQSGHSHAWDLVIPFFKMIQPKSAQEFILFKAPVINIGTGVPL